jgi:hypothetical protein
VDEARGPLNAIKTIGSRISKMYNDREAAYQQQVQSTSTSCSDRFRFYMNKRGHRVSSGCMHTSPARHQGVWGWG